MTPHSPILFLVSWEVRDHYRKPCCVSLPMGPFGPRGSKGRQTGSPSKSGKGADAAKSCLAIQGAVTWLGISANYAIRCVDSSTGMKLRTLAYPQYPVLSFLGLFTFLGLLRFIMVLGDENSDPDRAERAEYIAHLRAKEKRLRKMGLSCF